MADYVVFEILIPRTDGRTGEVHPPKRFEEWVLKTAERFGGITVLGINIFGLWFKQKTPIEDHSNWYKIGVTPSDVDALREHAQRTAKEFGQECLYFERCGEADLVRPVS